MPTRSTAATDDTKERSLLLEEVIGAHGDLLAGDARRHSLSAFDAEDALHSACVQFLRRFDGDDADHGLRWMRVTTRRCAEDLRRRRRRDALRCRPLSDAADGDHEQATGSVGVAELVEALEQLELRTAAIRQLKSDQRAALILIGAGYSYKEIARARGWTLTKINRCASEGRAALREWEGGENVWPEP